MSVRFAALLGAGLLLWSGAANGADVVGTAREALQIDVNKGALVRLQRPAASIFVANPEIADVQVKSPRLVYVLAKKPGETVLYAVDEDDRVLANQRVVVTHNLGQLRDALRKLVPNAPINVDSIEGSIVLSGLASSGAQAEDARRLARQLVKEDRQIVNNIAVVEPNQVNIRVQIAEVARSVIKEFGVNWDIGVSAGDFAFGLFTGKPVRAEGEAIIGPLNLFNDRNNGTNSALFGFNGADASLNSIIDALDKEGLATILAEPNLTAVSGKAATFLAGGEFPIVVRQINDFAIQYKQFGVSLAFTPTITGPSRITLDVKPEVSQLSDAGGVQFNGFQIPSLSTRRAQTTVELGSGQSFAIAGLISNSITRDLSKFPGLGDVPILGALFRSDRFQRNETELVIIVTPYIVRPVSAGRLALPTDGLIPPNDADRMLRGHSHRVNLERRPPTPQGRGIQGLVGPAGFVLD